MKRGWHEYHDRFEIWSLCIHKCCSTFFKDCLYSSCLWMETHQPPKLQLHLEEHADDCHHSLAQSRGSVGLESRGKAETASVRLQCYHNLDWKGSVWHVWVTLSQVLPEHDSDSNWTPSCQTSVGQLRVELSVAALSRGHGAAIGHAQHTCSFEQVRFAEELGEDRISALNTFKPCHILPPTFVNGSWIQNMHSFSHQMSVAAGTPEPAFL